MEKSFVPTYRIMHLTHEGVRFGGLVERSAPTTYRFVHLYDHTHRRFLPLTTIEGDYVRQRGTYIGTAIHSKWAARRRLKQYILLWQEHQRVDTTGTK